MHLLPLSRAAVLRISHCPLAKSRVGISAYTQNRSAMIDVATATLRMVGVSQHRDPQTLTAGYPTRCPLGRAA